MKITKDLGLFRHVEEYNYIPTAAELYLYYSGTHAGFTRNNPYRTNSNAITIRRYTKVVTTPKGEDKGGRE